MGIVEADIMLHHTQSEVRNHVLETGIMIPQQYGLVQPAVEQDLLFYLLTLLMQPKGRRNFRLMAHPQALLYSPQGFQTSFTIPSDVTRGEERLKSDPPRTLNRYPRIPDRWSAYR